MHHCRIHVMLVMPFTNVNLINWRACKWETTAFTYLYGAPWQWHYWATSFCSLKVTRHWIFYKCWLLLECRAKRKNISFYCINNINISWSLALTSWVAFTGFVMPAFILALHKRAKLRGEIGFNPIFIKPVRSEKIRNCRVLPENEGLYMYDTVKIFIICYTRQT